jgi:FMN phosphatase YigB (HAD superfamily)
MNPTDWWYTLIQTTLHPFVKDVLQPGDWNPLSDRLWAQFSSSKGYSLHEDSRSLINQLKKSNTSDVRFIVGVVSNSDPRVSKVLSSMGLILPSICGSPLSQDNDFQFIVSSYDAGAAKPNKQIFEFAESTARQLLPPSEEEEPLLKIYIGDDYNKDGLPAIQAGWNSILVDRDNDEMIRQHFPSSQVLEYQAEADSKRKPVLIERVRSLWPFHPKILSGFKGFKANKSGE